ncbi:MAG TPA: hypothetical protein VGF52_07275, partial [Tepidisphaeraceae bacterium]
MRKTINPSNTNAGAAHRLICENPSGMCIFSGRKSSDRFAVGQQKFPAALSWGNFPFRRLPEEAAGIVVENFDRFPLAV